MASSNPLPTLLPKAEPGAEDTPSPLDSIPPPPKRACISNACEPCRKRKSKCDGAKPSCSACTFVHQTDCEYDIDNDFRRKGAMRREISQLKAETEDKETILDVFRKGSEADVDDVIELIRNNKSYESIADSIKNNSIGALYQPDMPTLDEDLAGTRRSSQDSVGETRHYGHTCNLTVPESPAESSALTADQFETWTIVTNDGLFVMHLLQLYFTWAHPFYVLFPEDVFWHGLTNMRLKYCSPVLLNAILALACNFSDRPEARADPFDPTTVGNHFFAEAKRLLGQNPRPCVTNVQALGVMSLRQAMNNHDSSGWDYRGRMMNMSVELGLHLVYTGPRNGNVTETEVEVRRITFWGCYVLETAWAICLGRISSLPSAAIRLSKPSALEDLKQNIWKPYSDESSGEHFSQLAQPNLTYNLLHQSSLLSEIVNDTVHMFYAPTDRITSRKLQQYHDKFQKWYIKLPEVLAVKENAPTLPQVLTLHIYYHNCVNHLFRPFGQVGFKEGTKSPRQICLEEAVAISQLMNTYSNTYGLRRGYLINTHCITTAAMTHLLHMSTLEPSLLVAIQAAQLLLEAVQMLREMHAAFPIVARHLKMLRRLASTWDVNLPDNIRQALTDIPSPTSTNSNTPAESTQMDFGSSLAGDELNHSDRLEMEDFINL